MIGGRDSMRSATYRSVGRSPAVVVPVAPQLEPLARVAEPVIVRKPKRAGKGKR